VHNLFDYINQQSMQNENKNVLIAGGSGLVGKVLTKKLLQAGYKVAHLSRRKNTAGAITAYEWNPDKNYVDPDAIAFSDIIINLAGANVAQRWTTEYKAEITNSRVRSNEALIASCLLQNKWPKVYLSAGGMNYYGDSGDKILRETDKKGNRGFLPESCEAWERAVSHWGDFGVRFIQFRISIVLSMNGGALPKMTMTLPIKVLPVFGNGRQWYSWVHIEDLADMFIFGTERETMQGVYNAGSPNPLPLNAFLRTLAEANNTFAIYPTVPELSLKLLLGDMKETVLSSVRLSPEKLLTEGYMFKFPDLLSAFRDVFQRKI
jgi:uncharacterized protein (TIGR01777 family)